MGRKKEDEKEESKKGLFNIHMNKMPAHIIDPYKNGTAKGVKWNASGKKFVETDDIWPCYSNDVLREMIETKRKEMKNFKFGDSVELDFRDFDVKTVKYFTDWFYNCNDGVLDLREFLDLVPILSQLGFTSVGRKMVVQFRTSRVQPECFRQLIEKNEREQTHLKPGESIELDFSDFTVKTVEYFTDWFYKFQDEEIELREFLKLVPLLAKLGFTSAGRKMTIKFRSIKIQTE